MNDYNTSKLFNEFPNLYRGRHQSITQNLMSFGFSHGDGWFDIVYKLSQKLEKLIIQYKKENPDDPEPPCAMQVKEKFGTLRFYLSHGTDEMHELTNDAEEKSAKTCEQCGRPGKTRSTRWIRTLCEEHYQQNV